MATLAVDAEDRVVLANPRAAAILGIPIEQMEGAPLETLLASSADLRTEQARRAPQRPTLVRARPDGSQLDIGYTVSVLGTSPTPGGATLAVVFQDVSEVARLERERERLTKLAAVGEVLPSVLHELRNPMASVVATVELLLEERTGDEELQGELHAVLGEIRRAMLSLDGIGVAGQRLRCPRPSAVDDAILEVVRLLDARARRRGVLIVPDVARLPPLNLDGSVLRAMVINLIVNAIQAGRLDGRIDLRARIDANALELQVEDDGEGMTPEVLERCREIFFTTKTSGSGTGLALCSQIVDEAGGTMDIASERGVGTRVSIRIPVG
jgi:two-component system, sporulation sensor kinase E